MKYRLKSDHAIVREGPPQRDWDIKKGWEPVPDDPPAAGAFDIKAAKEVMGCITALLLQHDSSAADLRIVERYQGLLAEQMPAAIAEVERLNSQLALRKRIIDRRRNNVLLGLRGIGESEDAPEPEFTLGVLAAGLKAEVERLKKENTELKDARNAAMRLRGETGEQAHKRDERRARECSVLLDQYNNVAAENAELREQLLQIAALESREIPPGWVIGKGETP